MIEYRRELKFRTVRKSIWTAVALLLLFSLLLENAVGSAYYSLLMEPNTTVTSPSVILQNGINGTSTIYTNSTSAKVSVSGYGYDFVDNNDTDVDLSGDIGTHSNFTAQKYGPDLINDTLTEQDTAGILVIRPNAVGTKSDWNPVGSTNNWECVDEVTPDEDTTFVNTTSKTKKDFYNLQDHTTETGSISNVRLYVRAKGSAGAEIIPTLKISGVEYPGQTQTLTTSYTNYYDDWATNPAGGSWAWSDIDAMEAGFRSGTAEVEHRVTQFYLNVTYGPNYELDLEVQWTSVDFDETYEELCIKTGTFSGSEDIMVYAWNVSTSDWHFLYNLTANNWNNVSVTDWLNNENFTARFLGGTDNSDTSQDSWDIDATLLHVWTETDYVYDYVLRVNNTDTDSSWEIRLKKYGDSNIDRLQNCTIYFHNSSDGTSRQIYIQNGLYINQTGPWYDLGDSETIYIAMTAIANSTATSYVRTYLEILTPSTTTYAQYIITFEIT